MQHRMSYREPVSDRCLNGIGVALVLVALALLSVRNCRGAEVRIAWDPPTNNVDGSPLTDLAGYTLHWGAASRAYSSMTNVGNVCTTLVNGLVDGATYYFAGRAYNTASTFSDYSAELVYSAFALQPPVLLGHTYTISTGKAAIRWSLVTKTTTGASATGKVAGYRVLYGQVRGGPYAQASADLAVTVTTATVTIPRNTGPWYYVVEVRDTNGRRVLSATEGIVGTNQPIPPTGIRVVP